MGTLIPRSGTESTRLGTRHRVGRAADNDLVVPHRSVSGSHALLLWRDGRWWVRDLGSRNGTWLGDRSLGVGEEVALSAGDQVRFGTEQIYTLVNDDPPAPWAVAEDGAVAEGHTGLLPLPSPHEPVASVVHSGEGWVLEAEGTLQPVADGDEVVVRSTRFVLHLPAGVPRTWAPRTGTPALPMLTLHFRVSHDEEHVHLTACHPHGKLDLGARVTHYVLLTLARARLADVGEPAQAARGWGYRDELCRQLSLDELTLNTHVYRSRRLLAKAGVEDAAELVERRVGTGQLRLGVDAVEVVVSG